MVTGSCGQISAYGQQGFEACEDGNTVDNDDCTKACTIATRGDGIVWEAEACDDGNDNNEDDCTNECTSANCGDGVVLKPVNRMMENVSDTDVPQQLPLARCVMASCARISTRRARI